MPRGPIMMQLNVTQAVASGVTTVWPLNHQIFEFLEAGTVTVREIAVEKKGGVAVGKVTGVASLDLANSGFAELSLIFPQAERERVTFFAPSHVPSPQVKGAGLAILQVSEVGYTVSSPGELSVARRIGAHAYLDETA